MELALNSLLSRNIFIWLPKGCCVLGDINENSSKIKWQQKLKNNIVYRNHLLLLHVVAVCGTFQFKIRSEND